MTTATPTGASANYVFVDEEPGIVRVYDSLGELDPATFEDAVRCVRQFRAEQFAQAQAQRLGCEWGTNYG